MLLLPGLDPIPHTQLVPGFIPVTLPAGPTDPHSSSPTPTSSQFLFPRLVVALVDTLQLIVDGRTGTDGRTILI